jgi:hypothetical protein
MRLPSPIVAGSIAIAVFAGGFAVGHFATDDSGSSKAAGKAQVLGQVFGTNPQEAPPTTAAAPAAPPQTQNLTPVPEAAPPPAAGSQAAPTAVTPSPAQTQTPTQSSSSPPATSTVVLASPDCGNGTATARVASQTAPRQKTADTDYETDIQVSVTNNVDKAIQIDSLSVHLVYEDGGTQDVVFNNAAGNVIPPGITNNYGVALNTGKRQVRNNGVTLQSFSFHTQGHPECTGRQA